MKHLIVFVLSLMSVVSMAQKISTDIVTLKEDRSSVVFRKDVFDFKDTFIIWTSPDGMYMYNISNYTKISDDIYLIECSTQGKPALFLVNFDSHVIIVNESLIFVNSIKL